MSEFVKKLISYICMITAVIIFISLYFITVRFKNEEWMSYVIIIIGYISVILFTIGIFTYISIINHNLAHVDEEISKFLKKEQKRQRENLELIASENYVSRAVLEVTGSVLTNKYAEGYPTKRYYGGCENVDEIENLAIKRVKELFDAKYANVQPHSGSQANMAVYRALLKPQDVVLGMGLDQGGHLTHGHPLSFSGQDYICHGYNVDPETGLIDYDLLEKQALSLKPKMIIAGASAYPREIDFKRFREIADKVDAYLFVDMAHIAGLVACKLHMNPMPYADVVTSTTHKTLRGPRGGIILTNNETIAKKINQNVFPGIQGGPLMHIIAGKAVAFKEAQSLSFVKYQEQVIKNAKVLASKLQELGYKLITNGTDNHLILVDVKSSVNLTGRDCERLLDKVNITCNKNTIPNDSEKPLLASGIRLGTPALTSRGFKENEMILVATYIDEALRNSQNEIELQNIKKKVVKLAKKHPIYPKL